MLPPSVCLVCLSGFEFERFPVRGGGIYIVVAFINRSSFWCYLLLAILTHTDRALWQILLQIHSWTSMWLNIFEFLFAKLFHQYTHFYQDFFIVIVDIIITIIFVAVGDIGSVSYVVNIVEICDSVI